MSPNISKMHYFHTWNIGYFQKVFVPKNPFVIELWSQFDCQYVWNYFDFRISEFLEHLMQLLLIFT